MQIQAKKSGKDDIFVFKFRDEDEIKVWFKSINEYIRKEVEENEESEILLKKTIDILKSRINSKYPTENYKFSGMLFASEMAVFTESVLLEFFYTYERFGVRQDAAEDYQDTITSNAQMIITQQKAISLHQKLAEESLEMIKAQQKIIATQQQHIESLQKEMNIQQKNMESQKEIMNKCQSSILEIVKKLKGQEGYHEIDNTKC